MIDPGEQDRIALLTGGRLGGEYLDSIRVTDLTKLDDGQWFQLLRCIVGGYLDAIQSINQANDGLPHDAAPPF